MSLLALYLLRKPPALPALPARSLVSTAGVLLKYLGLLFVPAGVGVIANLSPVGAEWFPILVGLVGLDSFVCFGDRLRDALVFPAQPGFRRRQNLS
jgi:putative effector of murein hydrolase LrgA (UPF0299 family)